MADLKQTFEKQGGKELLRRWWRAGVLPFGAIQALLLGFSRKSLEILRLAVNNKILCKLRKKYRTVIKSYTANLLAKEQTRSNKVWVCWLQGMENAPELVQKCWQSLQRQLADREIVLLTEDNYKDYVTFPVHIQEKIDSGIISRTHFSDLLRLELLINHGGTWIDATVLCTDTPPAYMLDSDLFLFQNLKPGLDGHCLSISSWFMTACTNHPILLLTRHLLYTYWQDHNDMVDYFLIHDFFQLAIEAYPELWKQVIPFSNATPHILLLRIFDSYDPQLWSTVTSQTPIHKLSYKFPKEQLQTPNSYYAHIISQ